MTQYNIYFGTIGKKLGCKYQFTKLFKNESEAKKFAKNCAEAFFYKNEGKCGLPNYKKISDEAEITGLDIETLYQDHINDMTRYYVIPTDVDTISKKNLKY